MPATLCPDVGDVAAPHLIGALSGELAVQPVRDIWSLNRSLLVCVRAWLLADQAQLTHQPTHTKTANADAILTQHTQNEPPRLSRRLQLLRGWSHEDDDEVLPGSPRASGSTGIGTSRQPRVGMGSDLLDFCQDRLYRRNTAPLGTPGRARYWQT